MGVSSTDDVATLTCISHVPIIAMKIEALERIILMMRDLNKLPTESIKAISRHPVVIKKPMGGVLRKST